MEAPKHGGPTRNAAWDFAAYVANPVAATNGCVMTMALNSKYTCAIGEKQKRRRPMPIKLPSTPITPEMFKQAMLEAHLECRKEGCIHADAMAHSLDIVKEELDQIIGDAVMDNRDPAITAMYFGLHIGYRLGQLVSTPDPAKVN